MTFWRKRKLRVLALLARHGTDKYADAPDRLAALFTRRLPGVALDVVIIDNSLEPGFAARLGANAELIGGSNEAWEFSAWDAALARIGGQSSGHDYIALVTSAFGASDCAHLEHLSVPMLSALLGKRVALGHIDAFNHPVEAMGMSLQAWLRSSFILLPPVELATLGTTVTVTPEARLFSGDHRAPFLADAAVSPAYRRLILDWLTGEGTGQGVAWHSRFALAPATLRYFEAKARAVLNEQLLTARLNAQRCAPVDLAWLAAKIASKSLPEIIPGWRRQVGHRFGAELMQAAPPFDRN